MTDSATVRDDVVRRWLDCASANRGTPEFEVSHAAFRSILAGVAPDVADIAASSSLSGAEVERVIRRLVADGRMTAAAGSVTITGAGGLSLVESRHEMLFDGRRFWGWCALDAVGIPAALGIDAEVLSRCADTGEPVRIEIRQGRLAISEPASLAIALLPPVTGNLMADCCARMDFYADPTGVPRTAASLSLYEAMGLERELWRDGVPL
jgi:hypothetical protein